MISLPIMLGSAAQNIIVLSDNIFLFQVDSLDFAAIGLVGAFYLIIAAIGFGFSRGGQILIARRHGEGRYGEIGSYFQSMLFYEFIMALLIFFWIQVYADDFFARFIDTPELLERSLAYIYPRSYGIFFSFLGVSLISLYTGVARAKFIMIDTMILATANVILNYIFIFGAFGISPMGIRGAAIASTSAEIIAFVVFVIYMIYDKENRRYKLLNFDKIDFQKVRQNFSISFPIVAQSILGLGAYFVFFSLIENRGSRPLEVSNLIRNVYLILSIPAWGFAAGINTVVSNFIGNRKRQAVIPLIWKTTKINLAFTLVISLPVLLFPQFFLTPLYGGGDYDIIYASRDLLLLLIPILTLFSIGTIYLNGLIGTGHTKTALWIQAVCTLIYVIYCIFFIKHEYYGLTVAWCAEFVYWGTLLAFSLWYLYTNKWHVLKF